MMQRPPLPPRPGRGHDIPIEDDDILTGLTDTDIAALRDIPPTTAGPTTPHRKKLDSNDYLKPAVRDDHPTSKRPQGPEGEAFDALFAHRALPTLEPGTVNRHTLYDESDPAAATAAAAAAAEREHAEKIKRATDTLQRGFGPIWNMLQRDTVTDINRNPDGKIFVDELGMDTYEVASHFLSNEAAESLIGAVAAIMGLPCDEHNPIVEAMLLGGMARFTGVMPPSTHPGPSISIRRPSMIPRTLPDYIKSGTLSPQHATAIRRAISNRHNMLIVGSTGSGKTTFANALFSEIVDTFPSPDERFIIIEDTPELRCSAVNVVPMLVNPAMSMQKALKTSMRMSPMRICIGELRGEEALVLIKAWNTGHRGGLTTIHSSDSLSAMIRLESLIGESGKTISRQEIVNAVQTIIVLKRSARGVRRITQVSNLTLSSGDSYAVIDAK